MKRLSGRGLPRVRWHEAEPERLAAELAAMDAVAPALEWDFDGPYGGGAWVGELPLWPFERAMPVGLDLAITERFRVAITLDQSFPATEPSVHPINPEPSIQHRLDHSWHLRGDGCLCLLQVPADWTGRDHAADLAIKAAGWYLEYLLLEAGLVKTMSLGGLAASMRYDAFVTRLSRLAA